MSVSVSFIINIAVAVTAIIFTLYFNTNYDHTLPFKYKNYGDPNRPPIVIIPGLDGCVSFFQDVIPELTVEYNVIVFHLPLCDPSKDCSSSYTFPHISLELKKVLDELKLKRVSIIGESFGGVVAQQFAYQYPKHVSSLVLLSSLAKTNLPSSVAWKMNLLPIIRGIGFLFPVLSQTLFAHIHVQDIMEPTEPRFVRDLFLKDAGSAHFPSVMARISIVSTLDMVEKTKKITAPVLVVYGSEDHFTKQSSIELHSILSNSQLVSLPGGHLPHLTSPKKFAEMSMVFIGSKLIDEL